MRFTRGDLSPQVAGMGESGTERKCDLLGSVLHRKNISQFVAMTKHIKTVTGHFENGLGANGPSSCGRNEFHVTQPYVHLCVLSTLKLPERHCSGTGKKCSDSRWSITLKMARSINAGHRTSLAPFTPLPEWRIHTVKLQCK